MLSLGLARGRPSTHTRNKLVLLVQFMVSDHNNTVFTEITKCLEMLVGLLIFVIDCSSALERLCYYHSSIVFRHAVAIFGSTPISNVFKASSR